VEQGRGLRAQGVNLDEQGRVNFDERPSPEPDAFAGKWHGSQLANPDDFACGDLGEVPIRLEVTWADGRENQVELEDGVYWRP